MLPKRYNVEMRFWDSVHAAWRAEQVATRGAEAAPPDVSSNRSESGESAVLLHYVGRDKPWMRYERARKPDTPEDLCRKLREKDSETCARYLATQNMWWEAFGAGRCLIVGDVASGKGQGFVIDAFQTVLRYHQGALRPRDMGNTTRAGNIRCASAPACLAAAAKAGCLVESDAVLSLGRERDLPNTVRSLLDDVYQWKLGVFGGPASAAGGSM